MASKFLRMKDRAVLEPPTPQLGPDHRPRAIEALLTGYAEGSLDPYFHALIESHLILSEVNRGFVREIEAAAGAEVDGAEARPLDRAARDQVLAAIYAGGWYGRPRPAKIDPDVPEPIEKLIGARLDDLPWRFKAPGLREHLVGERGGVSAFLYRIKPGRRLPRHSHDGLEATLVLAGAFSDQSGRYVRGDVALADPSVDHRPVADPGGPCVCFAVIDAPLRLTGPIGRFVEKAFRR